MIMTTAFSPRLDAVVSELRERRGLDERSTARNFSATAPGSVVSASLRRTRTRPPADVVPSAGAAGRPVVRIADKRAGRRRPFQSRYFDPAGRLLLTSPAARSRSARSLSSGRRRAHRRHLGSIVAIGQRGDRGSAQPVLFSLQRGLVDPVLLATTKASRKVVSLHRLPLPGPHDPTSGIRPISGGAARLAEGGRGRCLTCSSAASEVDAPRAVIRSINYPRPAADEAPEPTDDELVTMVARLEPRKRIDHAIPAFALVTAAVPDARLEIYGSGWRSPPCSDSSRSWT